MIRATRNSGNVHSLLLFACFGRGLIHATRIRRDPTGKVVFNSGWARSNICRVTSAFISHGADREQMSTLLHNAFARGDAGWGVTLWQTLVGVIFFVGLPRMLLVRGCAAAAFRELDSSPSRPRYGRHAISWTALGQWPGQGVSSLARPEGSKGVGVGGQSIGKNT